jgi:beta-glucosidase/6-phospho-beta-glucosidase/beta-galactosidase
MPHLIHSMSFPSPSPSLAPDQQTPFRSFFLGGFECSSHRRADGTRLNLLQATHHDEWADTDYQQLTELGIRTARDGVNWHSIEAVPLQYDWSSVIPKLQAARHAGCQIIWDLCHYGWPDHLDIWSDAFVERFASFARAMAEIVRGESDEVPIYCPINEMSYWAWAGGDVGQINPCAIRRGSALKRQLVRAEIAAILAIRSVDPRARFVTAEPLIHIASELSDPTAILQADRQRLYQFEATDLLAGRLHPELGGSPEFLDIVGVNFYPHNQWYFDGSIIPLGHHSYRPLSEMLQEVYRRYRRPLFIAETGAEGSARASWLHYVSAEVQDAMHHGVEIHGICLYPVLDYPGWDNDRLCNVGLLGHERNDGRRPVCSKMADELHLQQYFFQRLVHSGQTTSGR